MDEKKEKAKTRLLAQGYSEREVGIMIACIKAGCPATFVMNPPILYADLLLSDKKNKRTIDSVLIVVIDVYNDLTPCKNCGH